MLENTENKTPFMPLTATSSQKVANILKRDDIIIDTFNEDGTMIYTVKDAFTNQELLSYICYWTKGHCKLVLKTNFVPVVIAELDYLPKDGTLNNEQKEVLAVAQKILNQKDKVNNFSGLSPIMRMQYKLMKGHTK